MTKRRFILAAALLLLPAAGAIGADDPLDSPRLLGRGKIFIRFTNTRPDQTKILIRLNIVPNHDRPFGWAGKTVYVGNDGEADNRNADRYLAPGQSSPWVDVGKYMSRQGTRSWETYLSTLLCGVMTSPGSDGLYVLADVAQGPGMKVIRRVQVSKPDIRAAGKVREYPWRLGYATWNGSRPYLPTLGLMVPTHPEITPRIYTLEEALRAQLDVIEAFPDVGRLPTKFVFKTSDQPEIKRALGYHGYPPDTVEGNLGDEISLHLDAKKKHEYARRFRALMKAKGFDPLDLIKDEDVTKAKALGKSEQWELVNLVPALPNKPRQFYESANFRYQMWYERLGARTKRIIADNPGKKVLVGANFSPHLNVWPDVRQWVDPFKAGAMTMTWTEDWWWQLPEVSPQVYGFLLDGLRLGGSYHGAPMQYYIMPFKGSSADNIRRMHGLALAHGAKIINHFVTKNQAMITWDYVDQIESPRTYQVIHDMFRDIGAVEHRLYSAMPEKAQVAVLLSRAADTWDTEDLGGAGHLYGAKHNINNDERKALWMALRHAQYALDLITDEDIAEGRLKDYRVLYIVGSEMLAAAVGPLKQWVKAGGNVYADSGGGLLDEYRQPQTGLFEMYGLRGHDLDRRARKVKSKRRDLSPRQTLPRAKPLDTIKIAAPDRLPAVHVPALLYREQLEPAPGARVVGRFENSEAAAVVNRFGKGRTLYLGALTGLAYLTPAITDSSQVLPTEFPDDLRELIVAPARWAGIKPPVTTSDPLVEAQYMVGKNGAIVGLINWRPHVVDKLIVRFPGKPNVKSVRGLRAAGYFKGHLHEQQRGDLPVHVVNGVPQVELRMEVTDFLLVD